MKRQRLATGPGALLCGALAFLLLAMLVHPAAAQGLPDPVPLPAYATNLQLSRSVDHTIRVTPSATGVCYTLPTSWALGSKVVSLGHWGSTTSVLFTLSATSAADFNAADEDRLKVLPAGGFRSLGFQGSSVCYKCPDGLGTVTPAAGLTGSPLELSFYK